MREEFIPERCVFFVYRVVCMCAFWGVSAGFLSQGPGMNRSGGPCLSLRGLSGHRGLRKNPFSM